MLETLKDNKKNSNLYNREVYDSVNDFTIETNEAIYITNANYH